jgi:hypothetical protein
MRTFEAPSEDTPATSMRVASAVDARVAEQAILDRITRV